MALSMFFYIPIYELVIWITKATQPNRNSLFITLHYLQSAAKTDNLSIVQEDKFHDLCSLEITFVPV